MSVLDIVIQAIADKDGESRAVLDARRELAKLREIYDRYWWADKNIPSNWCWTVRKNGELVLHHPEGWVFKADPDKDTAIKSAMEFEAARNRVIEEDNVKEGG